MTWSSRSFGVKATIWPGLVMSTSRPPTRRSRRSSHACRELLCGGPARACSQQWITDSLAAVDDDGRMAEAD